MKKLMTIAIISMIPMVGFAKVSDFNAMITENMQAQTQLHKTINDNVEVAKLGTSKEKVVLVDSTETSTYNAPTTPGMLNFDKEKGQKQLAQKTQFDRLATEVNDSDF